MASDNNISTQSVNVLNADQNVSKMNYDNDPLIIALKSEIDFLRKELSSKNRIIELIIKDNYSIGNKKAVDGLNHKSSNNNSIINKIKDASVLRDERSGTTARNENNISRDRVKISNRYEVLSDEVNSEQIINTDIDDLHEEKTDTQKIKKRVITICGDSTIKDIKPFKMRKVISSNDKIYIKSFPGAKIDCMKDYTKPSPKYHPDLLILHMGTNDLCSEKSPEDIAEDINLTRDIKTDENEVVVSSIVPRGDSLNEKATKVIFFLKSRCSILKFHFIDNSNIIPENHLNGSGLHLNYKGTTALANNFLSFSNM